MSPRPQSPSRRPPRDLFLGAFLGLAVGDALGSPHRGMAGYQLSEPSAIAMKGGGRLGLAPGQWTRDAGQFLAAVDSYLSCRGFEGEDLAMRLCELSETAMLSIDPETQRVLDLIAEDPEAWADAAPHIWFQSGLTHVSNDCLARAPVAAFCHPRDIAGMVESTIRLTRVTHADPRCAEACIALNFILVELLNDQFSPKLGEATETFLQSVRRSAEYRDLALADEESLHQAAHNDTPLSAWPEDRDCILAAVHRGRTAPLEGLGSSDSVVHTLQIAIASVLGARSFESGLRAAIAVGGDTGAQGAMAGLLLGARFGMKQIPTEWLQPLAGRTRIVSLAELLESESERLGES